MLLINIQEVHSAISVDLKLLQPDVLAGRQQYLHAYFVQIQDLPETALKEKHIPE